MSNWHLKQHILNQTLHLLLKPAPPTYFPASGDSKPFFFQFSGPKPWSHPCSLSLSYSSSGPSSNPVVSTFKYIQTLLFQLLLPPLLEPPLSFTWIIVTVSNTQASYGLQLTEQSVTLCHASPQIIQGLSENKSESLRPRTKPRKVFPDALWPTLRLRLFSLHSSHTDLLALYRTHQTCSPNIARFALIVSFPAEHSSIG